MLFLDLGDVSTYMNGTDYNRKDMRGNQSTWKERTWRTWRERKWRKLTGNERKQYTCFGCGPLLIKHVIFLVVTIIGRGPHPTQFLSNLQYLFIEKQQPQQVGPLYLLTPLWITGVISLYFPSLLCYLLHYFHRYLLLTHVTSTSHGKKDLCWVIGISVKLGSGPDFCFHVLTFSRVWSAWFAIATYSQTLDKNNKGIK